MRYRPRKVDVIALQAPVDDSDRLAALLLVEVPKRFGMTVAFQRRYGRGGAWWSVTGKPVGHSGLDLQRGSWLVIENAGSGGARARTLTDEVFVAEFDPLPADNGVDELEVEAIAGWARRRLCDRAISLEWLDGDFADMCERDVAWQHPAAQAAVEVVRAELILTGATWYQPASPDEVAAWDALRASHQVALRVEPQLQDAARLTSFDIDSPRHIVPGQDFRGPRRMHRADLALCSTPNRKSPVPLAGASTGTPSCARCLVQLQPRPGSEDSTAAADPGLAAGAGVGAPVSAAGTSGVDPVWDGLNIRQKIYLRVFFEEDQAVEREFTSGHWMDRPRLPAEEWRQLTFDIAVAKDSKTGEGYSDIQLELRRRGVHDPGAGSTLVALTERGLIVVSYDHVSVLVGTVPRIRVRLTNMGRKVARAGLGITRPVTKPRGLLSEWGWKVLARLYKAGEDGVPNGYDVAWSDRMPPMVVENLIGRLDGHPLAENFRVKVPYERMNRTTFQPETGTREEKRVRLTKLGRLHFEIHHRCYAEWYPEVDALDPEQPHRFAHADLTAHSRSPGRGLVAAQDVAFFLGLAAQWDSENPWPRRHVLKAYEQRGEPAPEEVLAIPPGLWPPQGKSKTVDRLIAHRGGPLVEVVTVPVDRNGQRRKLVTLTESGLEHARAHAATYERFYPEEFARSGWSLRQPPANSHDQPDGSLVG